DGVVAAQAEDFDLLDGGCLDARLLVRMHPDRGMGDPYAVVVLGHEDEVGVVGPFDAEHAAGEGCAQVCRRHGTVFEALALWPERGLAARPHLRILSFSSAEFLLLRTWRSRHTRATEPSRWASVR